MNITISPETEKMLEQRLKSGEYDSPDEVLHAALEALDEVSSIGLDEAALDAIDRAEDQIERGEVHDWKTVRTQVVGGLFGN